MVGTHGFFVGSVDCFGNQDELTSLECIVKAGLGPIRYLLISKGSFRGLCKQRTGISYYM